MRPQTARWAGWTRAYCVGFPGLADAVDAGVVDRAEESVLAGSAVGLMGVLTHPFLGTAVHGAVVAVVTICVPAATGLAVTGVPEPIVVGVELVLVANGEAIVAGVADLIVVGVKLR